MQAALAAHQAHLEELRVQKERAVDGMAGARAEEQPHAAVQEPAVEVLQSTDEDPEQLGPVAYAKLLCDRAGLTQEQRGPVALIARDMQRAWEKEMQRREGLTPAQREALRLEQWTIPGT